MIRKLLVLFASFLAISWAGSLVLPTKVEASPTTEGVSIQNLSGLSIIEAKMSENENQLGLAVRIQNQEPITLNFTLKEINQLSSDSKQKSRKSLVYRSESDIFVKNNFEIKGNYQEYDDYLGVDHCQFQPQISLVVTQQEDPSSDNPWSLDLDKQPELVGSLKLAAGVGLVSDSISCLMIEQEIEISLVSDSTYLILAGQQNSTDSCQGLRISGRGGENLEKPASIWHCLEDNGVHRQKNLNHFNSVDSSPFNHTFIFIEQSADTCNNRLLVDRKDLNSQKTLIKARWQDWSRQCNDNPYSKFGTARFLDVKVLNPIGAEVVFDVNQNPTTPIPTDENCEFSFTGGLGIGWVACWVFEAISELLDGIENNIEDFLIIKESDYNQPISVGNCQEEPCPEAATDLTYRDAWRRMRDFSTLAIVGTALFMIISTALNVGLFSNYTVKKYLPRLVIGTILIQLSWGLGGIVVQLFNQLGGLVEGLLFASFPGARDFGLTDITGSGGFKSFLFGTAGGVGAVRYATGIGWQGLLLVGGLCALGFLVAFLFLALRKYVIILFLIIAPLGLAFWILPGDDTYWKLYFKTFLVLTAIYPVIKIIITSAKIFAYLIML